MFHKLIFVLWFFLWPTANYLGYAENYEKKYDIWMDRIEAYNNTGKVFQNVEFRVRKFNRTTYALNLKCDLVVPMDDHVGGWVILNVMQGNEYKPAFKKPIPSVCDLMVNGPIKLYKDLVNYSNLPKKEECPIQTGHYELVDYTAENLEGPNLPYVFDGAKWKIDWCYMYEEVDTFCGALFINIKPIRRFG